MHEILSIHSEVYDDFRTMHIISNPRNAANPANHHHPQQQPLSALSPTTNHHHHLQQYTDLERNIHDAYLQAFPGMSPAECRHFAHTLLQRSWAKATQATAAQLTHTMEHDERAFAAHVHQHAMQQQEHEHNGADAYATMGRNLAWHSMVIVPALWLVHYESVSLESLQKLWSGTAPDIIAMVNTWVCPEHKSSQSSLWPSFIFWWFHGIACGTAAGLLGLSCIVYTMCLIQWTRVTLLGTVVAGIMANWDSITSDSVWHLCFAQVCIQLFVRTGWQLSVALMWGRDDTAMDITVQQVSRTKKRVRTGVWWMNAFAVCCIGGVPLARACYEHFARNNSVDTSTLQCSAENSSPMLFNETNSSLQHV